MSPSDDLPGDMRRTAIDPELVERLLDGGLEPDDAPDALAGIAALAQSARAPATADELAAEARVVAAMAAAPEDVGGVPIPGRKLMLTRVAHGKAAAVVVLAALGAGAVAAAVTANRPDDRLVAGATTGPIVVTVPTTEPVPTLPSTVPDTTPTTESTTTTSTTTTTTAAPTTEVAAVAPEQAVGPDATGPAAFGLCVAWTAQGGQVNPAAVAFRNLDAAAAAAGQTTADYCAQVIAAGPPGAGHPQVGQPGNGSGPPADVPGATAPGRNESGAKSGGNGGGGGRDGPPSGVPGPPAGVPNGRP